MVTSMHKPGWRSRRRSRLSLVERAVPKLGHFSDLDEGPKPTLSSPALTPPLKQALKSPGKALKDGLSPSERVTEESQRLSFDDHQESSGQAAASSSDSETREPDRSGDDDKSSASDASTSRLDENALDDLGPPKVVPVTEPMADAVMTAATAERTVELEQGADRQDDVASSIGPSETKSSETPPADDGTEALAIPAEFDPAVIEASLASLGVKPVSLQGAGNGTDADKDQGPSARPTPADEGPLELEWDSLIGSGFTDPRDRGQPLPAHMDPIIRTLLRQALSDQASWRDRVILVTSPTERVSKTTAAINFAFGLSTIGSHKAVLVDVDMTGAGAVGRLGGANRIGITEALADADLDVDELIVETGLSHLTLVASGRLDDEIIDHFGSQRMLQILRFLTEDPETILVIDAPPILVSQEAAVLNVIAGQVVMAVEAGRTTADQIEHALQRLGDRHNVSLVLNASSGVVSHGDDVPGDASNKDGDMPSKAEEAKRRLVKAAAIFVMMLALVASFVSKGYAATFQYDVSSMDAVERWSKSTGNQGCL
jgi:Mrp family chromosome partitioning ATPase